MIDIDHFKRFNDTRGHEAGDPLLRDFGVLLKQIVGVEDVACRYGGEEFVLLLPGTPAEDARERAEDLRTRAQSLVVPFRGSVLGEVTMSAGVATFPGTCSAVSELVAAADGALYAAKEEGRNRVVLSRRKSDKVTVSRSRATM